MADDGPTIRAEMQPDPGAIRRAVYDKLLRKMQGKHPDQVVILKGQRRAWRRKYKDTDLVKIVTAKDDAVCEACREMAARSPYTYIEAKNALPHHWGCRCQIAALKASDQGYLAQPTFKKAKRFAKHFIKTSIKGKGKKVPQRGATIKKLRKKGRRFVAPSGYRAVSVYRRKKGK